MNPIIPLLAVGTGVAAYLAFREDAADCLDATLPADLRSLAVKLLAPETGGEKLGDLIERTRSMRRSSEIATKQGFTKLGKCLLARAEKLEATIRAAGGTPATNGADVVPTAPTAPAPGAGATKPGAAAPGKAAASGRFKLPPDHGPARDAAILAHIRAGRVRPWQMLPVDCSRGGVSCTVYVSNDAVALYDADTGEFLRVNVTHPTAERIAIELGGAYLPTSRIADVTWLQANTRLEPHPSSPLMGMASTDRMERHNLAVENDRRGRGGIVRPVGKDWVLSNRLMIPKTATKSGYPDLAANYGWHSLKFPTTYKSGPPERRGTIPVIQPLSTFHTWPHTDYSQTVTLVAPVAVVAGKQMALADLLRHPTLSDVVSDEGPLKLVRHPLVEPPGGGNVA